MEQGRMRGKRALVVGGSPGIGSTIAERFREEGADVLVADLRGGDVEVDVRDASLVARAVDTVVERLGGLDTLVYNAGVVPSGGIEDLDLEVWHDVMRINVDGAFTSARRLVASEGWRRCDSHDGLRCRHSSDDQPHRLLHVQGRPGDVDSMPGARGGAAWDPRECSLPRFRGHAVDAALAR
jgi:NAD(P)-dependent dehydrogenase (short-subunit alcohol dehydrogenase family)